MIGAMTIDVVSDVVCPWCYIGKRRLEAALARLSETNPELPVQVRWHPFQLNPDLPAAGISRQKYVETKFGGPRGAHEVYARVGRAGKTAGIDFAFDAIAHQPNTLDAHRLISWGQQRPEGNPDALVERLFRAFFLEGQSIGERAALARLAADAGYDEADARAFLESDEMNSIVADADRRAREMGVSGVPFFIFDGKTAISGAQEPEALLEAIAQARAQ